MNGLLRSNGESVRFKLPVLVLGSGAEADLGVQDAQPLHCLIAPTPFGPALRAFAPVLVNGQMTAAALLRMNDVLTVGEESFTVNWEMIASPAPVIHETESLQMEREAIEADKAAIQAQWTALQARLDEAKDLRERSRSEAAKYLKEQRSKFTAEIVAHRLAVKETKELQEHLELCMSQLLAGQEKLRQDHEAAESEIQSQRQQLRHDTEAAEAAIAAKHLQLEQETESARTQLLSATAEQQAKLQAELNQARAALQKDLEQVQTRKHQLEAELAAERESRLKDVIEAEKQLQVKVHEANEQLNAHHAQTLAHLQAEQERNKKDAESTNLRIASAWEMVTATQKQMAEEKARIQNAFVMEKQRFDAHEAKLIERERAVQSAESSIQAKLAAARAELEAVEHKADQLRNAVPVYSAPKAAPREAAIDWSEPVPLNPKHDNRNADQLMQQLRQQERELAIERQRLAALAQNTAVEREQVHDQKQMVAEQMRALEANRRQWKINESQTLSELETLARSIAQREAELESRTHRHEPAILSFTDARDRRGEATFHYPKAA